MAYLFDSIDGAIFFISNGFIGFIEEVFSLLDLDIEFKSFSFFIDPGVNEEANESGHGNASSIGGLFKFCEDITSDEGRDLKLTVSHDGLPFFKHEFIFQERYLFF